MSDIIRRTWRATQLAKLAQGCGGYRVPFGDELQTGDLIEESLASPPEEARTAVRLHAV